MSGGFLMTEERGHLTALARNGEAECRLAQRANAIAPLAAIKALYPATPIPLHFIAAYGPRLNPIEERWRLIRENVTHKKRFTAYNGRCGAMLGISRNEPPPNGTGFAMA